MTYTNTQRKLLDMHMAEAANENRLDDDTWRGPTLMLRNFGRFIAYVLAGFALATFILVGLSI